MGVSYLLDTHAFYWLVQRGRSVPDHVVQALTGSEIRVSAVSAYELARKQWLGKVDTSGLVEEWVPTVSRLGARELPLTTEHALAAAGLDWAHRDPFDRMLAAQAKAEDLTLVTADPAFDEAGIALLHW